MDTGYFYDCDRTCIVSKRWTMAAANRTITRMLGIQASIVTEEIQMQITPHACAPLLRLFEAALTTLHGQFARNAGIKND